MSWKVTARYFCSSSSIYFGHKEPIKTKNILHFQVFGSKFVKFLMSILKWQPSSSSIFIFFFIVMKHKSTVSFKLVRSLLWTKRSHQSPNFDNFNCSGENFPNFSCHFLSNKSVFLQILCPLSVSWKIDSLYLFSSNNIYFAPKEPIKVRII